MRSFGSRRGNSAVRFMVEQSSRRRMWTWSTPESELPDADHSDPLAVRWTRRFFDGLRQVVLPRMDVVERLEVGELRWFAGPSLNLWALNAPHALVLAYEHDETSASLRERARRWYACLTTRTAPGLASRHWGHPVYGARLEPASDELDVVWAEPGEWVTLADPERVPRLAEQRQHAPDGGGFERS